MRGWIRPKTSANNCGPFLASVSHTAKPWHLGKVPERAILCLRSGQQDWVNLLVFHNGASAGILVHKLQPFISIHSQLAFTFAKLHQGLVYLAVQRLLTFLLTPFTLTVQYFDAGHGSSMEKHKVKVQELVSEYQRFEGDTGCTEVQGKLAFYSSFLTLPLCYNGKVS